MVQELEKDAFSEVHPEGLTPPLISLIQRERMLNIFSEGLLEPFTQTLLNKAVKTCANGASCRLPFAGRCCVCTLPLPCEEMSHNYKNELILLGLYEDSAVDAAGADGTASPAEYYTRSLQVSLRETLADIGLHCQPRSGASHQGVWTSTTAGRRPKGGNVSAPSQSHTAGLHRGSESSTKLVGETQSLWCENESDRREAVPSPIECDSSVPAAEATAGYRYEARLSSAMTGKPSNATTSPTLPTDNKLSGLRRSYRDALLEPLQLRSPQNSSFAPRDRPSGDRDFSPFSVLYLAAGSPRTQMDDTNDRFFAGCLPERYRRDREVAVESLDNKRKTKEVEAAQIAKLLAIEKYKERKLDARLKELRERMQKELQNQSYLQEKEKKRELRNRFLRRQIEEYYRQRETEITKKRGAGFRRIRQTLHLSSEDGDVENPSEFRGKAVLTRGRDRLERGRTKGENARDSCNPGNAYSRGSPPAACPYLCDDCRQRAIQDAPVKAADDALPELQQGEGTAPLQQPSVDPVYPGTSQSPGMLPHLPTAPSQPYPDREQEQFPARGPRGTTQMPGDPVCPPPLHNVHLAAAANEIEHLLAASADDLVYASSWSWPSFQCGGLPGYGLKPDRLPDPTLKTASSFPFYASNQRKQPLKKRRVSQLVHAYSANNWTKKNGTARKANQKTEDVFTFGARQDTS
ncbi:hypothetical protein BESB_060870 [Besnoitia besnoiti]|uniref:Uncharacterized protein n=1 Tax=Besnoitia besnoiti TaxID=94643 RepID=A0A2A9MIH2_BESBE|nr:hypothetical protein BESB_060870 [Besnoitia besnoiti]PFH35200.1 hypothetical protein BESB_060870 [Besnoitia besnoiti]